MKLAFRQAKDVKKTIASYTGCTYIHTYNVYIFKCHSNKVIDDYICNMSIKYMFIDGPQ